MRKGVFGKRRLWMRSAAALATAAAVGTALGVQPANAASKVIVQVKTPAGSNLAVKIVPTGNCSATSDNCNNPTASGCIHTKSGKWTSTHFRVATGTHVTIQVLDGGANDACNYNQNSYRANTGPLTVANQSEGSYWQVDLGKYL